MAKLLIIDDDYDTCEYIKDFFERRKCLVFTANSGYRGLEILKNDRPDLILLDYRMEGMNGLEVLKQIKQQDPQVKVIMITMAAEEDVRRNALENGADDFIKKPLNTVYLEGTVSLKVAALSSKERKAS